MLHARPEINYGPDEQRPVFGPEKAQQRLHALTKGDRPRCKPNANLALGKWLRRAFNDVVVATAETHIPDPEKETIRQALFSRCGLKNG